MNREPEYSVRREPLFLGFVVLLVIGAWSLGFCFGRDIGFTAGACSVADGRYKVETLPNGDRVVVRAEKP